MSGPSDLSVFRRDPGDSVPPPRRSLATRVLVPGGILVAFAAVLLWAGRDAFVSALDVRTVPVVVQQGGAAGGVTVARAAGWIEPDPFETRVPALVDGVVAEVLVLEGAHVSADQGVARLVADAARRALATAEAEAALARSGVALARERLRAEEAALTIELTEARGAAEERLRAATEEVSRLDAEAAAAAADARTADERRRRVDAEFAAGLAGASALAEAVADAEAARSRTAAGDAAARAGRARVSEARTAVAAAEARAAQGIGAKTSLGVVRAEAAQADDALRVAESRATEAALRLYRHEVRAPAAGVVLRRLATPGSFVGAGEDPVVTLYDPAHLRVRVDVPLADAGKIAPGQKVRVTVEALPGRTFDGEVAYVVPQADVQRNTVQAKVRLAAPDPGLLPEMLARAEFVGAAGTAVVPSSRTVLAPQRLLHGAAGGRATAWIVADGRAVRREVRLGDPRAGELVEVLEGLLPGDDLIDADPSLLSDGRAVRVAGDGR